MCHAMNDCRREKEKDSLHENPLRSFPGANGENLMGSVRSGEAGFAFYKQCEAGRPLPRLLPLVVWYDESVARKRGHIPWNKHRSPIFQPVRGQRSS